jgi:hypothetical protein
MLRCFHGPGTRSGKLIAIYSSDVRYFDVMDMRHPVPEANELVEGWRVSSDNFRGFIFANTARLWGTQNPKFSRARRPPRRPLG